MSFVLRAVLLALKHIVHFWGRTKCWVNCAAENHPTGPPSRISSVQRKGNSGFLMSVLSPLPSWAARQWGGCAQLWPAVSWGRPHSRLHRRLHHLNTKMCPKDRCGDSNNLLFPPLVPWRTHSKVNVAFSSTHYQHGLVSFLSWDICCLVTCWFSSTYGWRCMTWTQGDNS